MLALLDHSLVIEKLENHDIRVLIFGMGREVAIKRGIGILFQTTTNRHDLQRTVLLHPLQAKGRPRGCPSRERALYVFFSTPVKRLTPRLPGIVYCYLTVHRSLSRREAS
jgi:hypothetical protein